MKQHPIETNYLISEDGKVFDIIKNSYVNQYNNKGYRFVSIKTINNRWGSYRVHRLVAETYIQNPLNKPQINHIDGVRFNNNVSNLEWCTPKENSEHAVRIGLIQRGEKLTTSKLTEDKVRVIRVLHSEGVTPKVLAEVFNVDQSTIHWILTKRSWAHV